MKGLQTIEIENRLFAKRKKRTFLIFNEKYKELLTKGGQVKNGIPESNLRHWTSRQGAAFLTTERRCQPNQGEDVSIWNWDIWGMEKLNAMKANSLGASKTLQIFCLEQRKITHRGVFQSQWIIRGGFATFHFPLTCRHSNNHGGNAFIDSANDWLWQRGSQDTHQHLPGVDGSHKTKNRKTTMQRSISRLKTNN